MYGARDKARSAYQRIAGFLRSLPQTAEQLDPQQRWYRILGDALRHFLKGRQLDPPIRVGPDLSAHSWLWLAGRGRRRGGATGGFRINIIRTQKRRAARRRLAACSDMIWNKRPDLVMAL
jgi:hypothetical protein